MIQFCCSRSLIFGAKKIRIEFPKLPWIHEKLIRFRGLVVELHMHTNVYAVYACGCSLSVTGQVAKVNTTGELRLR